tara:strand:- start:877 stop:1209 length:333 start_codon:yes stop_codon:yes gene_type:complete
MSGNRRILLNTILGVILAASMVTGLSSLNEFTQSQNNIQLIPSNEDQELKAGVADERAPVMEDVQVEDQNLELDKGSVVVAPDPMNVGTPFAVALVAGIAAFTLVRRKIQ